MSNNDYIRQSLTDEEELIHIAQFHWMYTVNAAISLLISFALSIFILVMALKFQPIMFGAVAPESFGFFDRVMSLHPGVKILAVFIFILGLLKFVQLMIIKVTTEIGVTDIRLVYKRQSKKHAQKQNTKETIAVLKRHNNNLLNRKFS